MPFRVFFVVLLSAGIAGGLTIWALTALGNKGLWVPAVFIALALVARFKAGPRL
ncbi:hypothetical protein KM176_07170 [Pseudooceanicola sp. CBS1P-1]|uniref:Uncharacterized protein n=1 Tax=Pseudooceanicola albus TaxID=2692189 RepID=A0A6L7G207_9RHOB|nr:MULTISPECIES: hypothetical protein [Pseudooceanicola]MBT9383632.1 hypothetical protein [Pseudooceanicola endophyticus]MXN17487.1 hypothetical protein [Pseudooceanicola albus]